MNEVSCACGCGATFFKTKGAAQFLAITAILLGWIIFDFAARCFGRKKIDWMDV